jgi:citrate lyase subunit beta/citryl-CoA lyase
MRSLLFVPGDSPRKLQKGLASEADALIVDLEDSVAPAAKAEARAITADFVAQNRATKPLFIRINALSSGLADNDLAAVIGAAPYGIVLPKAEGRESVDALSTRLRAREALAGLDDGVTRILPIITETASATLLAPSWRLPHPRLAGLTWGAEDLSADIGASQNRTESSGYAEVFRLARSLTLLAAAACETAAVDTVFVDFSDTHALARECDEAVRDGFTAKMAIHPAQAATINAAFTPAGGAIEKATSIVEAFRAAGDAGVVAIGGVMYDRPHLKRAERLLARARAYGLA